MIRSAQESDAEQIQKINQEQLGYDYPVTKTAANLKRLLADQEHHLILVYIDDTSKKVIGYIHVELFEELYFAPMYNILALAVSQQAQHQGIGSKLMTAVERIAQKAGITEIRLSSGEERSGAHKFYELLGYTFLKKQKRFGKKLG